MEYSNWCNLPRDILALIAERLSDDLMDIGRLRAVCSTWHSCLPNPLRSSPVFPLRVPCPYKFKPTDSIPALSGHSFFLTRRILLRLYPLDDNNTHDPWIIGVEETGPNRWSLFYPFTASYFRKQFPNRSTYQMSHHINLLHYKVRVINQSYRLDGLIYERKFDLIDNVYDEAVVQSETGTIEADDQNFSVLIRYHSKQLAYWRSGDEMWTPVESGDCNFTGITCYQGDFFALDSNDGRLMRVDLDKSTVEMVIKLHQQVDDYMCLVNFENCLFLMTHRLIGWLRSYDDGVEIFRLYILNEKDGAWDPAKDLRNGVFFFGCDAKVSPILAEDLGCPKGNFVYHNDFAYFIREEEDGVPSGTCTPLVCDTDSIFATSLRGRWHDQLPFWPPPCWIMQTNKHDDEEIEQ